MTVTHEGIDLHGSTEIGTMSVVADLTVNRGETLAVLGPNGAGKSTMLNVIAGLRPLVDGRLEIGGAVVDEPGGGVFVPPERRSVGVVFQDSRLFDHMTLLDNVAFGPRSQGVGRSAANRLARDLLERVGLADRADHRPDTLSGGQTRRVALARALAARPAAVLLDEPMAGIDLEAADPLRRLVRNEVTAGDAAAVLVTHDPLEARALATLVVVIEAGRVIQEGTPDEISADPRSPFAARLAGVNVLEAVASGRTARLASGVELTTTHNHQGPVIVTFGAAALLLATKRPTSSARNTWSTIVREIRVEDDTATVRLGDPIPAWAEVTPAAVADLGLVPGTTVWASLKATETSVHPA